MSEPSASEHSSKPPTLRENEIPLSPRVPVFDKDPGLTALENCLDELLERKLTPKIDAFLEAMQKRDRKRDRKRDQKHDAFVEDLKARSTSAVNEAVRAHTAAAQNAQDIEYLKLQVRAIQMKMGIEPVPLPQDS